MDYIYKTINKALLLFLISAALLISACRNPAGHKPLKKQTEPNKTALSEKIRQTEDLYGELTESEDGADISKDKHWVVSTWKLKTAIETAYIILNDPNATADDIQNALEELDKAYNEANTAKQPGKKEEKDLSPLLNFIKDAENLLLELNKLEEDGKKVYTDTYWISANDKKTFADAISAAKSEAKRIAANPLAKQEEADEALKALTEAYENALNSKYLGSFVANKDALQAKIATAKLKMDGVKTSADGNDIPKYDKWVAKDKLDKLQAAITAAETLINDPHAREGAITAAGKELDTAITNFNPQSGKKPFDISQLSDLIEDAQTLLTELQGLQESDDGTDVYGDVEWISAAQKEALAGAIPTAQSVASNEFVKPEEAEQALDALSAVYNNAKDARKYGTFAADKTELQAKINTADEKRDGIFTSHDGFDILTSYYWVTHDVMAALVNAIIAANELNAETYARQEAVDAATQSLDAAIAAFTPQKGLMTQGLVNFIFDSPGDETITLTGTQTLSWFENTKLTVTVTETFSSYQWYVDGAIKTGETGTSISLNARSFSIGAHIITLKVTKGGVPYTKTLTFTVN